jgi:cytochrome c oxidase subunit 2
LSSADVTHGMQIIGTNVNLMAVPGAVNFARVKFDEAGDYLVVCNEYCGAQHHNMAGHIHVRVTPPAPPPVVANAAPDVLEKYGCTACHSLDGSPMPGPTFKSLYGSKRILANGTTVVADDAYITESILKPDAKVVKGFEAMPSIDVEPADLHAIVESLKRMK